MISKDVKMGRTADLQFILNYSILWCTFYYNNNTLDLISFSFLFYEQYSILHFTIVLFS